MRAMILVSAFVLSVAARATAQVPHRPETYGTSKVSYVGVRGIEFFPDQSSFGYATEGTGARYSIGCGGDCMSAALHLPSGARVVYLELDFNDTDPNFYVEGSLFQCDFLGQNCAAHPAAGAGPVDCTRVGWICSGAANAPGYSSVSADLTPDSVVIDNAGGSLRLLVGTLDHHEEIVGMIVGYVLQVSEPPGTPTFNDVPANHPFFQFIEALKASGITGGCQASPPLYCPDAPLTRGQMAVFLAKGLGLQWP